MWGGGAEGGVGIASLAQGFIFSFLFMMAKLLMKTAQDERKPRLMVARVAMS